MSIPSLEEMTVEELILELRLETEEIARKTARHADILKVLWRKVLPRDKLDAEIEELSLTLINRKSL